MLIAVCTRKMVRRTRNGNMTYYWTHADLRHTNRDLRRAHIHTIHARGEPHTIRALPSKYRQGDGSHMLHNHIVKGPTQ